MPHFVLICHDKPNSLDLRLKTREAHLAYARENADIIRLGGPLLSEDGQIMQGSLILIEAENLSAAQKFAANDPYAKAGLFESVEIRPWRKVLGTTELS